MGFALLLLLLLSGCADTGKLSTNRVPEQRIPVTSHLIDIGDDPEARYSGGPQFDWAFFGGHMQTVAKYATDMPPHRHVLGINNSFNLIETGEFNDPPVWYNKNVLDDRPAIPTLLFAATGKINATAEDGEHARKCDLEKVQTLLSKYPNAIFGGGQVAEVDAIFNWQYKRYFARLPAGVDGAVFPVAYFDFLEANLKRSSVPYMYQQHNVAWGTHYVAGNRVMSLGSAQLFYRHNQVIVPSLTTLRSAARQYPFPYGVQFSGQLGLGISNTNDVVEKGAQPVYTLRPGWKNNNYEKSYALCRQVLYLSWLNNARFFNWETGEFIRVKNKLVPSPLGTFTARAAKLIENFGPIGPVQTPIALISEFSHAWRPPSTESNKRIGFTILGDVPYVPGDYQMHGIRDFFYPHYLQSEMIYDDTMGEDYALCPTPYGESLDYLLSDVRPEALSRYGLVIWTGVAPVSPSVVREKLVRQIRENGGRAVLFGAAARSLFPEWFAPGPAEMIPAGAPVVYRGKTVTESADFTVQKLRDGLETNIPSLKVLATVHGKPLIVECLGGLVLALSDYGVNRTPSADPATARWVPGKLITEIPHTLLNHAQRLLDDEVRRQTLFSVGNEELHYVVTRPRNGEYVLGVFNDSLQSKPFRIQSNIGAITSQAEIDLQDNQDELKSVVGGIAYAPPGLRDSRKLPLDYGLSDNSHIEGRDFRLFRIHVQESGVRELPALRFPARPANRVLAAVGLESIRSKIQGMPSFFDWFDGVKVTANELLSVDDPWIAEQAHWLDRRGVRVAVDGNSIDEEKSARVIAKLALLKKAPKDLIIGAPSQQLKTLAALAGVRLIEPAGVNRLSQADHAFNDKAELNILDLYYQNEEDLCHDLRHFASPAENLDLRGTQAANAFAQSFTAAAGMSENVADAGPNLSSLKEAIRRSGAGLKPFNVLKIDSTYLLSKTRDTLAEDAAALAELKLKVIVDVRPDQMHFDRITYYPHIPNYDSGLKLYAEIIEKMPTLGAKDLIIRLMDAMPGEEKYIRQRDETWSAFATLAEAHHIDLHLVVDPSLAFSKAANFSRPNLFVLQGAKGKAKRSPYASNLVKMTP